MSPEQELVVRDFLLEAGLTPLQVDRMVRAATQYAIVLEPHQTKTFGDALGAIIEETQKEPQPTGLEWTLSLQQPRAVLMEAFKPLHYK